MKLWWKSGLNPSKKMLADLRLFGVEDGGEREEQRGVGNWIREHKFTLSRNWNRRTNVSHVAMVHQQDIMCQLDIDLSRLPTNVINLCLSWRIRLGCGCLCCMWNVRHLLSISYLCQFVNWANFIFLTAISISFCSYSAIPLVFKKGEERSLDAIAGPHSQKFSK